jgi:UBX domain-containing protein 1
MNVRAGQPVELRVAKRVTENYTPPPKRRLAAFSGSGNRLGSPAPGVATSQEGSMPGSFPGVAAEAGASAAGGGVERQRVNTLFEVDQSLPTTSVQIRLADGTRYGLLLLLFLSLGGVLMYWVQNCV